MVMFVTRQPLAPEDRTMVVEKLNLVTLSLIDLATQIQLAHWRVRGPGFFPAHDLYGQIYESVFEFIDRVAERSAALGGFPDGTVRQAAQGSVLPEYNLGLILADDHNKALSQQLVRMSAFAYECVEALEEADCVTTNMLEELIECLDKNNWFLEGHFQA